MNRTVESIVWRVSGWLAPAYQAYQANKHIKSVGAKSVDDSGHFDDAFVASWEGRLGDDPVLGQMADQIYEHETGRREAITGKAQSSLNATALVVAALSLFSAVVGTRLDFSELISMWIIFIFMGYFLMAFLLAFRAVHIQRYVAVEYDELDRLIGTGQARPSTTVARGIRARRLAAVFYNRQLTLCISNLVEASFMNLRNGIFVLLIWGVLVLSSSAPEGSGTICGELACKAGPDGPMVLERSSTRVPRSRYYEVWPRG